MSFPRFPRHIRLVYPTLFGLAATLALVMAPVPSVAQPTPQSTAQPRPQPPTKPTEKSSGPEPSIDITSPKKSIDWWVPGLLGASVMGAGIGITLIMRRSQPQLATHAPDALIYSPEPQIFSPPTESKASHKTKVPPKSKATPKAEFKADPQAIPEPTSTPTAAQSDSIPATPHTSKPPRSEAIATQTVRMAKPSVMDALVHHLRSEDPTQRQKAIWELGQRGDSRAVQPLVDLLLDSDSQQRGLVLSALSEISTRTLNPVSRALAISLQDENADVRKNAIRDLTRVYDLLTNVSQLLQSACEDPDTEVQETAKWALGQINRIKAPLIESGPRLSISRPETL